ncbi:MAG: M20/M25/M40 family metallo-hydrolase [Anaerolineae bacterium]|nr:M20/M25/M40 family metallo-hydrolase [Anaerolineae bacterium]
MTIYERPAELLQNLIRFDTTNPPGNEAACIQYVDGLLHEAGFETTLLERTAGRPNVLARLKGEGSAPPLLLYGHVDVVPTVGQDWQHPPFSAEVIDDYIWGRGALDMKGGVAMMLAAFLRARAEGLSLSGDVIMCVVSDEEDGGDDGAKFLVEQHADLFEGVRYAIGEFGGFALYIDGKRFYPIQVSEKGVTWFTGTVRGPAGHASTPMPGGTMASLAKVLDRVCNQRLPIHITEPARLMFQAMAAGLDSPMKDQILGLLDPSQTDDILDEMGETGRMFNALLHNTASPTMLQASNKINVIPGEVSLRIDCRVLPGESPETAMREIQALAGDALQLKIDRSDAPPASIDMGLFDTLSDILREADPDGTPMPLLMPAATDGRFFARIGIQTYGFLPMNLTPDFDFWGTIHAANERIPVSAVDFGTRAVYEALRRFK